MFSVWVIGLVARGRRRLWLVREALDSLDQNLQGVLDHGNVLRVDAGDDLGERFTSQAGHPLQQLDTRLGGAQALDTPIDRVFVSADVAVLDEAIDQWRDRRRTDTKL